MALNDNLSNALSHIMNCEKVGKKTVNVACSKVITQVLTLLKQHGYVKEFKVEEHGPKQYTTVTLLGQINKCNVIKPRFPVKKDGFVKYEKRYLPAFDIGFLIVSTPKGLMTHHDAKKKNLGGRLVAYVY
ncbi:30S ribosomal protein S8 [archaeon]|nr:30S ribosomal protein S8 [archaeon]|tara:strand:+ start:2063 stop:2452 length:390 start_codon:yes stop_codon:yes gene_type:complete